MFTQMIQAKNRRFLEAKNRRFLEAKNLRFLAGFVPLIAAIFSFSLAGCANGSESPGDDLGDDPGLSGTIVISATNGGEETDTARTGETLYAVYNNGAEIVSYQWNKDGTAISGETDGSYTPDEEGSYTVTASALGYQSKTSAEVVVTEGGDGGLDGTWEGNNGAVIIFDGDTFEYRGPHTYSGTFIVSGSNITFLSSSFGAASGNFALSEGTLTLSNHLWDDSINDTYTKAGA
jgi:hypothetical protein